jgi:hypothetical protein
MDSSEFSGASIFTEKREPFIVLNSISGKFLWKSSYSSGEL